MTNNPDPLDPEDHDQAALDEAEEKMLLRHDHAEGSTAEESTDPSDGDHDPAALAEAEEKMLLRDEPT